MLIFPGRIRRRSLAWGGGGGVVSVRAEATSCEFYFSSLLARGASVVGAVLPQFWPYKNLFLGVVLCRCEGGPGSVRCVCLPCLLLLFFVWWMVS